MFERMPNPSDPYMSRPSQPSQPGQIGQFPWPPSAPVTPAPPMNPPTQPTQPNPTTLQPDPWEYVRYAERLIEDFTGRMMRGTVVGNGWMVRWDLPEAPLFAWQQAAIDLCVAIEQIFVAYSYRQLNDAQAMRELRRVVSTGVARLRPGLAIPGFWTGPAYYVLINQRMLANTMRMQVTQVYEDFRQVFGSVLGM